MTLSSRSKVYFFSFIYTPQVILPKKSAHKYLLIRRLSLKNKSFFIKTRQGSGVFPNSCRDHVLHQHRKVSLTGLPLQPTGLQQTVSYLPFYCFYISEPSSVSSAAASCGAAGPSPGLAVDFAGAAAISTTGGSRPALARM
jgi:hypothetical protein